MYSFWLAYRPMNRQEWLKAIKYTQKSMPRRLFIKESFAYYNFAHIYNGHLAFLFKMCQYVHKALILGLFKIFLMNVIWAERIWERAERIWMYQIWVDGSKIFQEPQDLLLGSWYYFWRFSNYSFLSRLFPYS